MNLDSKKKIDWFALGHDKFSFKEISCKFDLKLEWRISLGKFCKKRRERVKLVWRL